MVLDDEIVDSLLKDREQIRTIRELNSWDEEADNRVIIHTDWAFKNGEKQVVILQNNSGTLKLLLQYIDRFMKSGLEEPLLEYSTDEKYCMIPLHVWYNLKW